jgi:hypothetical protein
VAQLAAGLEPSAGDAGDADIEPDAGAVGLSYAQVSAYVPLSPGSYDVRLVAAGAPSCAPATLDASGSDASSILVHDSTDLPSLAPGTYTTLLVAGDLSPAGDDASLAVSLLTDDAVLGGGAAALRAINASPSQPALDFGLRSSAQWAPLLTDVTFGAASAHAGAGDGTVDRDGYLPIAPLSGQAMSTRASFQDAGVDIAAASGFAIDQGSIATLIAIGGKTGDATNPPALLLCVDNEPSGGLLSDCSLAP